jgi:hypothetical protein
MDKPERRLIGAAIAIMLLAMCLAGSFLAAFHEPKPHGVNVGVVAPPPAVQQLRTGLEQHAPGAFDLASYPDAASAQAAIMNRDVEGAFVASGPQGPQLLIASGAGLFPTQLIEKTFTALAAASGQQVHVTDVSPLPAADTVGLKNFFVVMATLIPSMALGAISSLLLVGLDGRRRLGGLLVGAILLGLGVTWVADGMTGTWPGGYWALAGIVALFSFAVSTTTAALARLSPAGVVLALLGFLVLGVPPTGGPARFFVPSFFRVFDPWLPTPAAVTALRNVSYFDGNHIGADLWSLAIWAVVGLVGVLLTGRLAPHRHGAHATPYDEPATAGRMATKEA